MFRKEFTFKLHNTNFNATYFKPKVVNAIVVLIHGMGEHSGRYENYVIPSLNKKSLAVLTYDQFGHGKTSGKRGHNPSFNAVLDCVDFALKKAIEIFGDKPIFLYGHSMGGNVVMNYVLRRNNTLNGVIVTSPFLRLAFVPPKWKLSLGKLLLKYFPSVTMTNDIEDEALTRDQVEVERYQNDPLIHSKVSPNYSIVFIETGEWVLQNAMKLNIPMLLMHGTADRITSSKASEEFAKNADGNVDIQLYTDAFHELHNELNKREVLKKITDWILFRLDNPM